MSEGGHQGGQRDRVQRRDSGLVVTSQPGSDDKEISRCANKATARAVSASNMEWSSASSAQRTRVSDTTHVTCVSWLAR